MTCDAQLCTDDAGNAGRITAVVSHPDGAREQSMPISECSEDRVQVWHGLDMPAIALRQACEIFQDRRIPGPSKPDQERKRMRVTIKIDSASAEEVRALQQAMHAACGPDEIGGTSPHQHLPGTDTHSPTAVYAWAMGPQSWSASTPPVPGAYGTEMLRELAERWAPSPAFNEREWRMISDACDFAAIGDAERDRSLKTISEQIRKAYS